MSNVMPLVYLAGPINGTDKDTATSWRRLAREALIPFGISTVSPMRGKRDVDQDVFDGQPIDGHVFGGANAIYRRDRWDCMRADLVLVNLERPSQERVPGVHYRLTYSQGGGFQDQYVDIASLGTVMEIAWADAAGVFTIAVIPEGSVHDHVLVKQACGVVVETLDEALRLVPLVLGVQHDD